MRLLVDLHFNEDCDPTNIPEGSQCYKFPASKEALFECNADMFGLRYQWGGGGVAYHATALVGDYLYGCSQDGNLLKIWDVQNPAVPSATGALSLTAPNCIAIYQGVAFIGATNGNLYLVNIDNPASPTLVTTTGLTGQNWSHIRVVGALVFLSGPSASVIGVFDTEGNLVLQFTPAVAASALDIEGRRIFFGDSTATDANLYNYRIGGFRCAFIDTGSLYADEVLAEVFRGRHLELKGDVRASSLMAGGGTAAETDTGVIAAPNYYLLGAVRLLWGVGVPGVTFSPQTVGYFFSDGSVASHVYFTMDGGATWVGIA